MRKGLVSGLLIWVPIGITVFLIQFLVGLFDKLWVVVPRAYHPETLVGFPIPGLSILIAVLVVWITGLIGSNFLGRQLFRVWERLVGKIPGVRAIYQGAKQVTEALVEDKKSSFQAVYLVEYPKEGLWTLAFETSTKKGAMHQHIALRENGEDADNTASHDSHDMVNLFVPTTPNPTSGYYLIVHKHRLIPLNISVDDALKILISAGMVVPNTA